MRKLFYKIKAIFSLTDRLLAIEHELNEIDARIEKSIEEHSKQFEKKIQEMTFSYTRNLDDTKSDYLKRYLEVRMDCVNEQIRSIPSKIANIQQELRGITSRLEEDE